MDEDENLLSDKTPLRDRWWQISGVISLILLCLIIFMWFRIEHTYQAEPNQISQKSDLIPYINNFKKIYDPQKYGEPTLISTGVFIDSFYFSNQNTPVLSGYIWMKYTKADLASGISPGFILPESTGSLNITGPAYDVEQGDHRLIGWRFVGVPMYQQFDYRKYPFDRQLIWIRIWPKEFFKNILLIPDFAAYPSMKSYDTFGIEDDIAMQEFNIKETFFDYAVEELNTNFGFGNFIGNVHRPDLYFNISLERKFYNGFILYLIPVTVIWGILFALTMITTNDRKLAKAYNFSTTGILSTLGAIFFSILIAQINLRSQFSGHPITYIENFYFLTYILIFFLAINAYLTNPGKQSPTLLGWENNLLPKLLFWPVILTLIGLLTVYRFFIPHASLY